MKTKVTMAIIGILCISMFSAIVGRQLSLSQTTGFFQDGFETGDFSKWTPTGGSPTVTSGDAHHGTYKAVLDASGEWAQVRFTGISHGFMRAYVMFKSFPAPGTETTVLGLYNWASGRYMAEARVGNFAGTIKWRLLYYHNGTNYTVTSEQQNPALDTWYSVEVEGVSNTTTNAETRIYIDGNELTDVSQTGRNNTYTITSAYVWASSAVTRWYDCIVVDTAYIGQETPPSIGEFAAPSTAYANQYFYLNATINAGKTLALTDFDNATVQVGDNIVLGWINSTNTFSVNSDPNNHVTLNASASLRSTVNSTAYKLSWCIKLNNYPSGNVSIEAANTKVFDSGGFYGSNSEPNLFSFVGLNTLVIAAADGGTTDPVPGTYSYLNGAEVDVLAIPCVNYILGHWELDGIDVGSLNPVTITMDSNHTLEAFFVYSVHDIILTDVIPEKTVVGQEYSMLINVTVYNSGNYTETFNVTIYANSTEIEQLQLTLNAGDIQVITSTWNTTDFVYGNYNVAAYAWPVPDEANTTDNTIVDGWIFVTIAGDVDGTRRVDMRDLGAIGRAFGATPSDPRWNPNIDIDDDSVIDMRDIGIAARSFGKSW